MRKVPTVLLACAASASDPAAVMGCQVLIKLADGRTLPYGQARDTAGAAAAKARLERWFRDRDTVSVATCRGRIDDIASSDVVAIEIVEAAEPATTPAKRTTRILKTSLGSASPSRRTGTGV